MRQQLHTGRGHSVAADAEEVRVGKSLAKRGDDARTMGVTADLPRRYEDCWIDPTHSLTIAKSSSE